MVDVLSISYFVIYLLAVFLLTLLSVKIPTKIFPFKTKIVDKVIASNGFVAFIVILIFASLPEFGFHIGLYPSPSEFVSVAIVFIDYSGLLLLYKNKEVKVKLNDRINIKDAGLTIEKTDASGKKEVIKVPEDKRE